jgi:hypothetical protein
VHGETLRVEFIRDDLLRVKIGHGGMSKESPSFPVCVNAPSAEVAFTLESEKWGDTVLELARDAIALRCRLLPCNHGAFV